jgi:diguanylate cyclase (GGDEF)-like protein
MLDGSLRALGLEEQLTPIFQPIVQLRARAIIGYESMVERDVGKPLNDSPALFDTARADGRAVDIDTAIRREILAAFVEQELPGKLFLKIRIDKTFDCDDRIAAMLADIRAAGLYPEQVVIVLSPVRAIAEPAVLKAAVARITAIGFRVAIDDIGNGYASLRLWFALRPDYVSVDFRLVPDTDCDAFSRQFLSSMRDFGRATGTTVIVGGLESARALKQARDLGLTCGKGSYLGGASSRSISTSPKAREAKRPPSNGLVQHHPVSASPTAITARRLLRDVPPVAPSMSNDDLLHRFAREPDVEVIPVVNGENPVGLVTRRALVDQFAKPFMRELHGRKSCTMFMDAEPLVVDHDTPIQELSKCVVEAERRHLFNGFIVTDQGRYLGMATGHDLIREITSLQISAARYANPLTGLPGNVPINEQIDRLIAAGMRFAACYVDLDNFKSFNDCYGYRKGDDVIQLTARLLDACCDPDRDFVGHIGGDDFLILFQSEDWEARCKQVLEAFGSAIARHFEAADVQRGGYVSEDRRGRKVMHPLITLSLGVVKVEAGSFRSHLEIATVASEAKGQSKRMPGNSLFIDRRVSSARIR